SERVLTDALGRCQARLGKEHSQTRLAMMELADTYAAQQKYAEAERLLIQVVPLSSQQDGSEHPETLMAKKALATVQGADGMLDEALAAQRGVPGDGPPERLLTIVSLASRCLGQNKRLDEIEPLLKGAWQACRVSLDRNHEIREAVLALLAALYGTKRDP